MKETLALIERIKRVNATHQRLHLTVDPALAQLKAGQTVLARVQESWQPYLRQQWWPVAAEKDALIIERPAAETYTPGQVISLIGAVGQPFRFRRTLRNVLLMAWRTEPTPLLMPIAPLLGNRIGVTLVLLGEAAAYQVEHLPPEVEILTGDADMNWPNRVTTVGWADQVFAVVPEHDEMDGFGRIWALFSELRAEIPPNYLFGVFRPLLPCGVGACQACTVRTRGGPATSWPMVCTDGPALDLTEVATWR